MISHARAMAMSLTLSQMLSLLLAAYYGAAVASLSSASASASAYDYEPHSTTNANTKPFRVFILVGQSNMVGHGQITNIDNGTGLEKNATLEWLTTNVPDRFGMLKKQLHEVASDEEDGEVLDDDERSQTAKWEVHQKSKWTVRPDVLMACNSRIGTDLDPYVAEHDNLYAGLCAGEPEFMDPWEFQLGPELGFGWTVGNAFFDIGTNNENNILLLKVAWGGKSLAVDFRPPSSGNAPGPYYESVITTIKNTLNDIESLFPKESVRPVQLSGFAWHQGWNDGCEDWMAQEYEQNLANLIRDVRTDLNVPGLPFAIASTGMVGYGDDVDLPRKQIINAELNVATYPEFKRNVVSVDTRPFARDPAPASPTDMDYHWMSNAESYWLVGESLGEAMIGLVASCEEKHNSKQRISESA